MGQTKSTAAVYPQSGRLEKHRTKLGLGEAEVNRLYDIFTSLDRANCGQIENGQLLNYFTLKRNIMTLGIFDLVGTEHLGVVDFGEFVDIICTFCMFEPLEVMKFVMFILDPDKKGDADIKETVAFVGKIWNEETNSNIDKAVDYLKSLDEGDGRVTFKDLNEMQKSFPQVFFPAYRLIILLMQKSLGDAWWENKKREHVEKREEVRKMEQMKLEAAAKDVEREEARQFEELVKKKMGINYYFMFWSREKARSKVRKIQQINKQLEAIEKKEAEDAAAKAKPTGTTTASATNKRTIKK